MSLLEINNATLKFGGVVAVNDLSFSVEEGEVYAIVGPNGAGKSTAFNLISRFYEPFAGSFTFDGNNLLERDADQVADLGIARTFQNIELFEHATVLQNLLVGRHRHRKTTLLEEMFFTPRVRREEERHREAVEEVIDFLDLQPYRNKMIAGLPYGVRKVVELGRALASKPRLLLLDEPASGLSVEETQDMRCVIMPNASDKVKRESGLLEENFSVSEADILLFCGGGYFSEPPGNSIKWALSRYKLLFKYASYCKIKKIPYSILGVGAGPINSNLARYIIKHVCKGADVIALRDHISVNTISKLVPNSNIVEVSDYVLSLRDKIHLDKEDLSHDKIGFHITVNGEKYIPAVIEYLKGLEDKSNIYFIEDHPGEFIRVSEKYQDVKDLLFSTKFSY